MWDLVRNQNVVFLMTRLMSICSFVVLHLGFKGGTLVLIAAVPGDCFPFAFHYVNTPMQYTAIFKAVKNDNFQLKFLDYLHIFA